MPDANGQTTPQEAGWYMQQQRNNPQRGVPRRSEPRRRWPGIVAMVVAAVLALSLLVDAFEDELWPLQNPTWWDGAVCSTHELTESGFRPITTDAGNCADAVNVQGDPAPSPLPTPFR